MQFVAASKLKRAQDATLQARPYSQKLDEVLADLAVVLGGDEHPLLARREGGQRLIVLVTSDRVSAFANPAPEVVAEVGIIMCGLRTSFHFFSSPKSR